MEIKTDNPGGESAVADEPKYVSHDQLNKALDARFAKLYTNIEKKFEGVAKQAPQTEEEVPATTSTNPEFAKLARDLKKEKEARVELENRLASEKIHNELVSELRGKVSDTWIDVASSELKSLATVRGGTAQIEFDGVPYNISEAVQEWISKPENKRFLPAPTNAKTQQTGRAPILGRQNGSSSKEAQVQQMLAAMGKTDFFSDD
jgi:hypothetical protein